MPKAGDCGGTSKDFVQETRRVEDQIPTGSCITRKCIEAKCAQSTELELIFHDPPAGSQC